MAGFPVERILVVATRQIGDVLLTAPLIEAAKRRWPGARIDILGFAGTMGMLRGHPQVGEFIEVPAGSGWRESWGLIQRLWRRYDLALITQHSDRAHIYGWIAARHRSGVLPQRTSIAWWKRRLLDHAVIVDDEHVPTVVEKLSLLDPWAQRPERVSVSAPPEQDLPADIASQLVEAPVVVHVPSMWRYKQWPPAYFARLVKELLARGQQVVLTGTASETDQSQIAEVRGVGNPPALLDVSGRLNLNQLAGLLKRAALYVGPDTSVTHLAAAAGTPVVTIFGPTNPVRWGPWPQDAPPDAAWVHKRPRQSQGRVIMLQAEQDCVGCGRAGCEDHRESRSACLEAVPVERVLAECLAVLDAPANEPLRSNDVRRH